MHVYSELIEAQLENKASDPTPATTKTGQIYYKSTTEPLKVNDGTQIHKVLTDKMYAELAAAIKDSVKPDVNSSTTSSTGFASNSTFVYTDITNLSASITTTGRPVEITFTGAYISLYATGARPNITGSIKLLRGTDQVGEITGLALSVPDGATPSIQHGPGILRWSETPAAGTHTYKLQFVAGTTNTTIAFSNIKMTVREL